MILTNLSIFLGRGVILAVCLLVGVYFVGGDAPIWTWVQAGFLLMVFGAFAWEGFAPVLGREPDEDQTSSDNKTKGDNQ